MHACMGAETPAWRRGAQGGSYAGQHLCNRCGVDQYRHPDPVEVRSAAVLAGAAVRSDASQWCGLVTCVLIECMKQH